MVRFAAQISPFLLVRESLPASDRYRCGEAVAPTPDPVFYADGRGDPSVPDPFDDADALEELDDQIATLAAHIHAATHGLLVLIACFDRRRGWELGGHRSCAHWLSYRTGIDMGAAREKVRAARALEELPETRASMARGELSFSKVRALTRVATTENEGDLVELARGCTAAQLERMVRAFSRGTREEEADLDRVRQKRRCFSVFPDEDGMYVVKGRLPAEVGALLMRAVEAASDALFREEAGADSDKKAAQRRADALGLLAERALAAGFENGPVSGTRAARYQVMLHVEPETLRVPVEPVRAGETSETGETSENSAARSELEDGTRVSAETSRRISCDCGVVRVTQNPGGAGPADPAGRRTNSVAAYLDSLPDTSILSVGRRTRTIPPAIRRALEVRDRGCRFPGCGSRFTDAHHVQHWADGGETSLDNCLLLCHHHHRLVHEGGWRVDWWGSGRPVFFDPRGGTHFEGRWRPPESAEGSSPDVSAETSFRDNGSGGPLPEGLVDGLVAENRLRGIDPDSWTPSARWKREEDIPEEVLFRAGEALCGLPATGR